MIYRLAPKRCNLCGRPIFFKYGVPFDAQSCTRAHDHTKDWWIE